MEFYHTNFYIGSPVIRYMATGSAADTPDVSEYMIEYLILAGNDGCTNRASDLITIAICFDHKIGLFVGGVPSDVFEQAWHATLTRMVDAGHRRDNSNQLLVHLDAVLKSYKKDDKNDLYNTSTEISGAATRFFYYVLNCQKDSELSVCLTQTGE